MVLQIRYILLATLIYLYGVGLIKAKSLRSSSSKSSCTRKLTGGGFVHAQGTTIVDGNNQELMLRGMGLGGWMVQEPYMMKVSESASGGQHDIFNNIADLIGYEKLQSYRNAWLDNYISQQDVRVLKKSGFNSIRIPIHYNLFTLPIEEEPIPGQDTWLNEGFGLLDRLLHWCRIEGVYAIIDLHAAPGGQGRDAPICDYDDSKPSLWEHPENIRKTISLWKTLAARYANEEIVAGYDLLNEPNWNFDGGHDNGCWDEDNAPLKNLYDHVIPAIREVDNNHLIFIEGNCWANNHNNLWPIADDNVALSFHRYWNDNNVQSIQQYLDIRDKYDVPLWMGESGENHQGWYKEAVQLLEVYNIGWSWWAWKKMESDSGTFSIPKPNGYDSLIEYWKNGNDPLNADLAYNIMIQVATNARMDRSLMNYHSTNALTEHARSCDCVYAVDISTNPGQPTRIQAEDNCQVSGMGLENSADDDGGINIGWIDAGDHLSYNINVPTSGSYKIEYRVASLSGQGGLRFELPISSTVLGTVNNMPKTGWWQNWNVVSQQVQLQAGPQTVRIEATGSGWNFNWFEISYVGGR